MATVIEKLDSPGGGGVELPRKKMTLDEFNAIAEEPAWDRMLIRGELWEKPSTQHDRWHAKTEARIVQLLHSWLETQTENSGEVFSGEVGCDFPDLETGFGIDVAYFSDDVLSQQSDDSKYIVGPPILAVEVLSPSERKEEIDAKVLSYLDGGVKLIWIVDYRFQTVTVYRPDADPKMFTGDQEITGEEHLLGFSVPVSKLFQR